MPKIRLQLVGNSLRIAGRTLRAWRARVYCIFLSQTGQSIKRWCLIDSGAPLSVLPYSLWHSENLAWNSLGDQVMDTRGRRIPLHWFGVPCEIGETEGSLADQSIVAGPLVIVAKFPRAAHANAVIENTPVLGLNFLSDNRLRLGMDGRGAALPGHFSW